MDVKDEYDELEKDFAEARVKKGGRMTPDYECLIAYLEARRDMQSWTDEEWDVATCVIDWLKSQLEELVTEATTMCDLDGAKKSLESLLDEVRDLKAERDRLRAAAKKAIVVLDVMHPVMNPDEPCIAYEAWTELKEALAGKDGK